MNKEFNYEEKKMRPRKKTGKIRVDAPSSDMFTRLCHSELHVECVKEYRFYKPRLWRFDYALPLYKIAVEVEGGVWTAGRHIRPRGFLNDMTKYNTAALLGWRVFRTTPNKLLTNYTMLLLKNAINGSFDAKIEQISDEK
jgi:hypothetical protein